MLGNSKALLGLYIFSVIFYFSDNEQLVTLVLPIDHDNTKHIFG